ncbi:MAG: sulfotransferase [Planctomycetales bacterium]
MTRHIFVGGMSRSGTTLLATVLDSHRDISMGYEMLPADLPIIPEALEIMRRQLDVAGDDGAACADLVKHAGHPTLGTFIKRCARTNVTPHELIEIFEKLAAQGHGKLTDLRMRAILSMEVVKKKQQKEGTGRCGFKLNVPSVETFRGYFEDSFFALIVRDPRDVVASHFKRGFDRTLPEIVKAWVNYTSQYMDFARKRPKEALVVRYEDLVSRSRPVLTELFQRADIEFDEATLRFYQSDASVHAHGHANSELLRQNFFCSSIGRWTEDLDDDQIAQIDRACGKLMDKLGYAVAPEPRTISLGPAWFRKLGERLAPRRYFYQDQFERLLEPYRAGRTNLTLAEAASRTPAENGRVLIIRHDIDHDIETAVKIAHWERERGLRATYCVLHSAEYYGVWRGRTLHRSSEMVDAMLRIQELGHEVCLHNNVVATALERRLDPAVLLEQELIFLRRQGLRIVGTSSHGDKLCRELDFRNFEIFAGRAWDSRGGVRSVVHKGHRVDLGTLPLERFGLAYEAYDLPRDRYLTEAGGRLRLKQDTRGQAGRCRAEMNVPPPYEHIVGVLTHPIWWDFDATAPEGQELPPLAA